MAVIKIYDCNGVKTVKLMGNANEQDYDPVVVDESSADQETDGEE